MAQKKIITDLSNVFLPGLAIMKQNPLRRANLLLFCFQSNLKHIEDFSSS